MTYRVRNIVIAVALALVAAMMTSFYVTNYQRNVREGRQERRGVRREARHSGRHDRRGSRAKGLLEKSKIVRRIVVPGAISNPDQLAELVAVQPVYAGEQVSTRRFATPAERGIRAQIKGTMRAFQFPGDQHQLLAGTLKAGDHVDVVASLKVDRTRTSTSTRIVLRDIEVLKAAATTGVDGAKITRPKAASR